ncbi:Uncharacterised protein [Klebsiella pneumoniae]|uniref:Uncharacterized protein n=1 Tax=Klebsiella pneumoniae TaxID=573 RepID=A0A2X1Q5D1_KLEPN|nr:Uncharacterised protein [Klebsiella pneumoniae]
MTITGCSRFPTSCLCPNVRCERQSLAAAHHPYVAKHCITLFFQQASQTPQLVALIWMQEQQTCQLSYAELAQQALKLAHWLQLQGTLAGR